MKKEFEITEEELKELYEACKPTPVMYLSGGLPIGGTPQQNANQYWQKLGKKYGFVWDTAKPNGKGKNHFTAEVLEAS